MSSRRGTVRFLYGPMSAGKSTLALQTLHNLRAVGRIGLLLTSRDRSGPATVSSRLGIRADAYEVTDDTDLYTLLAAGGPDAGPFDFCVCDEAQFYRPDHIDQLTRAADDLGVDVHAFGIITDFATRLFPGSKRLLELADERIRLPLATPCWCGADGQQNARVVDGVVVHEGAQLVVGDVAGSAGRVHYQVLCRAHWRDRQLGPRP